MLSNVDRELLQRCLDRSADGWGDFVERYVGLVKHVVLHTTKSRSIIIQKETLDEFVSDVFFEIIDGDFAVLRRYRGQSSLATYLTVIARRVVTRRLGRRQILNRLETSTSGDGLERLAAAHPSPSEGTPPVETREEIEAFIRVLSSEEADAVRMFYLEGKSYREISIHTGMSENSVGPYLTRARNKMKENRVTRTGS